MTKAVWDNTVKSHEFTTIGGLGFKTDSYPPVDRNQTSATLRIATDRPLIQLRTTQYAECVVLTASGARALAHSLLAAADMAESTEEATSDKQ